MYFTHIDVVRECAIFETAFFQKKKKVRRYNCKQTRVSILQLKLLIVKAVFKDISFLYFGLEISVLI